MPMLAFVSLLLFVILADPLSLPTRTREPYEVQVSSNMAMMLSPILISAVNVQIK
jgi:hypothetical protein